MFLRYVIWITVIVAAYAAAVDNHARDFIKESITVHNYRKKDHECRGYILINDLQLLLCNNTWNQSKDEELTIAAMVGAGKYYEPDDFAGLSDFVMYSIFRQATLLVPKRESDPMDEPIDHDSCHNTNERSSFTFHQNTSDNSNTLKRFIDLMSETTFEENQIDPVLRQIEFINRRYRRSKRSKYDNFVLGRKLQQKQLSEISTKKLIKTEAARFFKKYYSSDNMLIALSSKNIDSFSHKYIKLLSMMPKRYGDKRLTQEKVGYKIYRGDESTIELIFPLKHARLANEYATTYLQTVFFGGLDRGFQWLLTESGLATSVSVLSDFKPKMEPTLTITAHLTDNGLKNSTKVLELIFSYLNRIRKMKIEKWPHDEIVLKHFDTYFEKMRYVEGLDDLAERAWSFGLENSFEEGPRDFDEQIIKNMLADLNAFNFNYILGGNNVNDDFQAFKMSEQMLANLNDIRLKEADTVEMIKKKEGNSTAQHCGSMPYVKCEEPDRRKLVVDRPGMKLWFSKHSQKNKTFIAFTIMVHVRKEILSSTEKDAQFYLMVDSMNYLVHKELATKMTGSQCYSFTLERHATGMQIVIHTEPEKMDFIVNNLFYVLKHKELTESIIRSIKDEISMLVSFFSGKPTIRVYKKLLHSIKPNGKEWLEALKGVTLASLEALRRDFLSKIKIEALISGRIDLQVAIDRFDHFVKHLELNGGHISDLEINWPMVLQLEKNSSYIFQSNLDTTNGDNVALIVYQPDFSNRTTLAAKKAIYMFQDLFLEPEMHPYFEPASVTLFSEYHDQSIVLKIAGKIRPRQMDDILEEFMRNKIEHAIDNFGSSEEFNKYIFTCNSDMYEQIRNPEIFFGPEIGLNTRISIRNAAADTYRTMFLPRFKQMRKLAIYLYADEKAKMTKDELKTNEKMIDDIDQFRSDHSFVRIVSV